MSAIVSGKRSFFEELSSTPPASKRIRCSSRFTSSFSPSSSPPSPPSFLIDQLISIFPHMDKQVLERALEECGDDLDSAIRSLNELCLGSADRNAAAADKTGVELEGNVQIQTQGITANGDVPTKEQTSPEAFSMDGSDWVELFVREMLNASNIDDARARASRALEVFDKSIHARAGAEVAQNYHQVGAYYGCYSCYWLCNIGIKLHKLLLLLFVGKYDAERTTGNTNSGKYYSQASCCCST
uniref:CUE domain-containing protein n=1 Tax=Gossypium raimondii TaxID=29730 RepID=A0A0D2U5X9_GOSRA|nr:hypothetical protein B456_013G234800 [Gossypium raimondii]KJB83197.1 hypothetical protein B456_013G234800 [Gossypium raimondii]KJB83198.1 hypothetical protein B456_013G234800 [Gossypium raimondii]